MRYFIHTKCFSNAIPIPQAFIKHLASGRRWYCAHCRTDIAMFSDIVTVANDITDPLYSTKLRWLNPNPSTEV